MDMGEIKKIKTVCRSCHGGCGVIAQVKNGKVVKVEGDPDSPISFGTLCSKGMAITQIAYHPDRILHPMKKTGHGWERITWDEALDTITEQFNKVIQRTRIRNRSLSGKGPDGITKVTFPGSETFWERPMC